MIEFVMVLILMACCISLGRNLERSSWIARSDGMSPHYANGKFYYVNRENQ